MKNFKFRLQSLLDLWQRELAQRHKAVEEKALEIQLNLEQQDQLRQRARQSESSFPAGGGCKDAQDYLWHLDYLHRLGVQMEQLMGLEQLLREELEALEASRREAACAHRRLEIYRDRLHDQWRSELAHGEAQVLDEWGVLAFARDAKKH